MFKYSEWELWIIKLTFPTKFPSTTPTQNSNSKIYAHLIKMPRHPKTKKGTQEFAFKVLDSEPAKKNPHKRKRRAKRYKSPISDKDEAMEYSWGSQVGHPAFLTQSLEKEASEKTEREAVRQSL